MGDCQARNPSLAENSKTWDPGDNDYSIIASQDLSHYLYYVTGTNDVQVGSTDDEWEGWDGTTKEMSRTELDTHVNMPVVGLECYVISDTGKTAKVFPYRPDYESKEIPIVHAAVQYDCPYTGTAYVL